MNWEATGAIGDLIGGIAVLVTLIYLALQVRHSRELLEKNERISLSQVHQARADTRINLHLSQAAGHRSALIQKVWGNPDAVAELDDAERAEIRQHMLATVVHQDNVIYQLELGLMDEEALLGVAQVVSSNLAVWEALDVFVPPRVKKFYDTLEEQGP